MAIALFSPLHFSFSKTYLTGMEPVEFQKNRNSGVFWTVIGIPKNIENFDSYWNNNSFRFFCFLAQKTKNQKMEFRCLEKNCKS